MSNGRCCRRGKLLGRCKRVEAPGIWTVEGTRLTDEEQELLQGPCGNL